MVTLVVQSHICLTNEILVEYEITAKTRPGVCSRPADGAEQSFTQLQVI